MADTKEAPRLAKDVVFDMSRMDLDDETVFIEVMGKTAHAMVDIANLYKVISKCAVGGLKGVPRSERTAIIEAFATAYKDDADPKTATG